MSHPYDLEDDPRPKLGLLVLQVDETIEDDLCRVVPRDLARLHIARLPSGAELTPDTIAEMKRSLPAAAGLLPPAVAFDVIGYGCTSGTTLIGAAEVARLVGGAAQTRAVTDPLTAAMAATKFLGLQRMGIVSPYIASVAGPIRDAFVAAGIPVVDTVSFGEEIESRVARIAPSSIVAAAKTMAARSDLDGVFLSCTNLRTFDIIETLEAELSLPVLSSNQVLAWDMARAVGLRLPDLPGRLGRLSASPFRQ